jgi:ABC-type maltose transport system permease subunit
MTRRIDMSLLAVWKATSPAVARYLRRMYFFAILYAAILVPVTYVVRRGMVSGNVVYILAVLPALPILGLFWAMMRLLVEMTDEYQRMLMVRQTLIATGITISVTTVWGFLTSYANVIPLPSMHVATIWLLALMPAQLLARLDWK